MAGLVAFAQAFMASGWKSRLVRALACVFYALAGTLVISDSLLASLTFSMMVGVLLCAAGVLRVASAIQERSGKGRGWAAAAGVFTVFVGILTIAGWPGISLWLLGAMLTIDLVFEGAGLLSLGIGLGIRNRR